MSATRPQIVTHAAAAKRLLGGSSGRLWFMMVVFIMCFLMVAMQTLQASLQEEESTYTRQSARDLLKGVSLLSLIRKDPAAIKALEALDEDMDSGVVLPRADVLDRNGEVLATSLQTASLFANAKEVRNPEKAAAMLAQILPDIPKERLLKRLQSGRSFVWLKRNLTPHEKKQVNDLGIVGLDFITEHTRVYPYGRLTSHVLGFVGIDNRGLGGVERHFDQSLQQTQQNEHLSLALDIRLQGLLHHEMSETIEEFSAIGGTGVVADIHTGEVLAMVSLPDFDPHHPLVEGVEPLFNRASLGAYEMGSTFKSFTVAAALDYNIVPIYGGYDITAPIRAGGFSIRDTHPEYRWMSIPEIYAYSSNIGTVKMVLDLGVKRQQEFLGKLGLLAPLEIELPERAVPLVPNPWREISMMTVSYGHGISVSPLHLVQAIATIAGDGVRRPLSLQKGGLKQRGVRVVSEQTALQMRRLMRAVVQYGTARKANAVGYRVGGKTGTAEKVSGSGYNHSAKLASFVGVFPVDNPRYVVLMMIDEPQPTKKTYGFATGGWVSAPAVGRLVEQMAPMVGVQPVFEESADSLDVYWKEQQKFRGSPLPELRDEPEEGGSDVHL